MTEFNTPAYGAAAGLSRASFDAGLRAHMMRIYNYMMGGLALTGATAFAVANIPALYNAIFGTGLSFIVMLAPLAFIFFLNFRASSMSVSAIQTTFWAFCGTMGLSMATIFVAYSGADVTRAFFITAAMFGGTSLYGYVTKKDLSGMGSFMMMGLIGIIIASVVNIFLHSSALVFAVSIASVLVFTGLTAWDTQQIKQSYAEGYGVETNSKLAIFGALSLYMNFINLFMAILRLVGNRR